MAYPRRRTVRRRAPIRKRYGKRYGRARFTKKRFAKNNVNQLTMRAPLASRLLRIKLPWVKTFDPQLTPSIPTISYAFQGNGIVPYTAAGASGFNLPAPGDSLPAGEIEYSSLYDKYFINGSSIKVECVNIATQAVAASPLVRCVLLAIPFSADSNDGWQFNKAQLDGYSYEQLLAWPYAKWRMLGSNTGGASRLNFKMFRKTKSMSGLKDLRDNNEYGGQLTDGTSTVTATANPTSGHMYYLRFFLSAESTVAAYLAITVRMSLYCTLTHREFNPIVTITAP